MIAARRDPIKNGVAMRAKRYAAAALRRPPGATVRDPAQ